ncbi:hypothetical protein DPMN_084885 [Dreissena polymorpha]|uniref:Uncharacterized protein n=1 Tax=Dreissena polymorpha TaxID=45954 RepID=A0A9D3YBR9_DREPO|nr:hypothetical protein DPMN_084885 [Dreissena polymorpha]
MKQIKGYGEVVPVDLSINLKEDGNQAAFTFINGPAVGNVDCLVEIDSVVIRDLNVDLSINGKRKGTKLPLALALVVIRDFRGSIANSDRRTKSGDQYNIPTFLKAWG